jgi:hypothetical protein
MSGHAYLAAVARSGTVVEEIDDSEDAAGPRTLRILDVLGIVATRRLHVAAEAKVSSSS